jgi:hypothetical protein
MTLTLVEQEPSRPQHLGASALGVLPQAERSILVVKSGDEGVVEGGSVGGGGHEGHEGGLAGVVGGGIAGGEGAGVLLEAVVLLVELLEHLEDDAEVDVGVGDVDLVGAAHVALAADADEGAGSDGSDGGGDASDDGGGSGSQDSGGGDGGGDGEGSDDGLKGKARVLVFPYRLNFFTYVTASFYGRTYILASLSLRKTPRN